ncbi:MAG TPA: glycosyltransferase 87 family protein [Pseudonocardiaceae bacterium]|nr:glycosyltransferase 87 family protein [Pseudonocardiaceae bacterium]
MYRLPEYAVIATVGVVIVALGVVDFVPRQRAWPAVVWYRLPQVMVPAALLGIVATIVWAVHSGHVSPRGFVDLSVYRLGVDAWWHDDNVYGELPLTGIGLALPFTYPPFAVLALGPLAIPPWQVSIACITVASLLCLSVVAFLTIRVAWPNGGKRGALVATAAVVPLSLLLEPVEDTVWFGQVNLVLMALVVVDCLVDRPRWPRGLLAGVAAAVKLTPAVFLLYFLLRKDYRAAVTMTVTAVVATGVGFVADWSGSLTFWFGASGGAHAVGDPASPVNQSLTGMLARFGLTGAQQAVGWAVIVPVLGLFAAAGVRRALREDAVPLAVVITAGFGLAASPISWGHHWVYVVPAVIALVACGLRPGRRMWLLAAAAALLAVFRAAAFLDVGSGHEWPPLHFLGANSYLFAELTLLAAYAGPGVVRRAAAVAAGLRRAAVVPTGLRRAAVAVGLRRAATVAAGLRNHASRLRAEVPAALPDAASDSLPDS